MCDVAVDRDHCILVVEDEESARETLIEVVEMAGCSAIGAANGAEGLHLMAKRRPCLVIVDLFMPVMSGFDMLDAMRRQPDLAVVPVVISTSAPDRAPPGVPVIAKPIDVNAVWAWMRRTCSCARAMPTVT